MKSIIGVAVLLTALVPGLFAKDKKNAEPFYRRYLVAGDPLDDKILDQEKRIEADPKNADLHNDFGNLLATRRFPKEARGEYEQAMKLDPHHFLAPYNLGLLFETLGDLRNAMTAYETSVDRNRGFPPSRFRLGRLYEKTGFTDRAIEQYSRALQIDPGMRDPRRNPLIVDTRLLARVSLENYERDLAVAARNSEAAYVDKNRLRKVPVDRSLSTEDLEPAPAPAPDAARGATTAPAAGPTPVRVAPSTPQRRPPGPNRPAPAPVLVPTPEFDLPPEAPAEPPPPLPTPDQAGGRPPYVGGFRPGGGAPPTPVPTPEN